MNKIRCILALVAAMAVTAAHAADSILWDINGGGGSGDGLDATVYDFINGGVSEDITTGTVSIVAGSGNSTMTDANGITLSYVSGGAGISTGGNADPITKEYLYTKNSVVTNQIGGLTSFLKASSPYKLYLWGIGDNIDQGSAFTFNGTTLNVTQGLHPNDGTAVDFFVVFEFTTASTVSDTLDFSWADQATYGGFNGFAIVEDDGSTPPVVDLPPSLPGDAYTVISNMAVEVKWAASGIGTEPITYNVKRSLDSGSGYVTIGSTTNTVYVDTTVATNETYYYVVNATNAIGESANTDEATGVGLPYDIIGTDPSNEKVGKDNLFDNDIATIFDHNSDGAYAGLDYGTDNALQIMSIAYTLRGQNGGQWNPAVGLATDAIFQGANSADFSDAVVLYTIPSSVSHWPAVNTAIVTNTSSFRYVRVFKAADQPCYFMAEIDFVTENDVTAEGTSKEWLDLYYDISGANPSNFADYAEADYSDTDNDGLLAWQEYKLSGDPTDANSPAGVNNLYAWPEAPLENVVRWDATPLADIAGGGGYIVYRSLDNSTFTAVATVATNVYTDMAVTDGVTYYYKASATNATYEHETVLSAAELAQANQYAIFGVQSNAGSDKDRWFYELFDKDDSTFMDDNAVGGLAGLDYGFGNGKVIEEVYFRLRAGAFGTGVDNTYNEIVVNGETQSVKRAQAYVYGNTFEGSNDTNGNWTVLATITNMVPQFGIWNVVPVTDATAYRYVRYYPANGLRNFAMADVEFPSASDYTAKGTPIFWLAENNLTTVGDQTDGDSDGHEAWQEFRAYTDPNDSTSVLKITSASLDPQLAITWQSVEGVNYSVISNTSLTIGTPGAVDSGITGLAGETSYTGTVSGVSGADAVFYSIGVE